MTIARVLRKPAAKGAQLVLTRATVSSIVFAQFGVRVAVANVVAN